MKTLEDKIVQWHRDRNLFDGSTDHQQFEKLLEEVEELRINIQHCLLYTSPSPRD